jgi:hypothetical protein
MSALGNQTHYVDSPYFDSVGDGVTTSFALSWAPGFAASLIVVVGGVPQPMAAFTVANNILTFTAAPPNGARILVFGRGIRGTLNKPASGSVTSETLDQSNLILPANAQMAATPAAADNSTKLATTAWLYAAIATVMSYFGFAISLTANGYIKFPSILGGLIVQWGAFTIASTSGSVLTFPVAFPNAMFAFTATDASSTVSASNATVVGTKSASTTDITLFAVISGTTLSTGDGVKWIAIGY